MDGGTMGLWETMVWIVGGVFAQGATYYHRVACLSQSYGCGQTGNAGADDDDFEAHGE
jgi:hypothetical protein